MAGPGEAGLGPLVHYEIHVDWKCLSLKVTKTAVLQNDATSAAFPRVEGNLIRPPHEHEHMDDHEHVIIQDEHKHIKHHTSFQFFPLSVPKKK